MLPSVPLPLCHGPCPVLHSRYCCGGFTCCDVPSAFRVLLVSRYTFRVLGLLVRSSAVLGPVLRVRSRAEFRPCCAFGIAHSARAVPSKSRTQCYSSRIVSRLGLFVRRYSSHLLLYSFGATCFARVSSVILRIAGCRSECGEALRPQEEGLTTTPATMTTVEGREPPSVTFPAVLPPSVEGIPIKGGTITPPHSANPSTHRYPRHSGPSPTPITPATPSTHKPPP